MIYSYDDMHDAVRRTLFHLESANDDNTTEFDDYTYLEFLADCEVFDIESGALNTAVLDDYARASKNYEAQANSKRSEARKLIESAERDNVVADRIKQLLLHIVDNLGGKVDTEHARYRVQNNGGVAPLQISPDVDVNDLPDWAVKTHKFVDTKTVRKALENGEQFSWAKLGKRGKSLRIK